MSDKFLESEQLESAKAIACQHCGYPTQGLVHWIRDAETGFSVLTWAGALALAETHSVSLEIVRVHNSRMNVDTTPAPVYHAVVKATLPGGFAGLERSRYGAASSRFKGVAILLAQRNAIRQVFPGQNGTACDWFFLKGEYGSKRIFGSVK